MGEYIKQVIKWKRLVEYGNDQKLSEERST